MDTNRCTTGRATNGDPLAVTVQRACELTGLGPTSIWALLKDGRLEAVKVPGVRRTLISYASVALLLVPASAAQPQPRRRGCPRKNNAARVLLP
jgi:excisionase family DNA binding protein